MLDDDLGMCDVASELTCFKGLVRFTNNQVGARRAGALMDVTLTVYKRGWARVGNKESDQ
jgi:hypothetical protein